MTNAFTPAFDFRTDMLCTSGGFRLVRFASRVFIAVGVSCRLAVWTHSSGGTRRRRPQPPKSFADAAKAVPCLLSEPEDCLLEIGQNNHPDLSSPPGDFGQVVREPGQHPGHDLLAIHGMQLEAGE
jgi:hypothetical protein